jgi:hypothetical protein
VTNESLVFLGGLLARIRVEGAQTQAVRVEGEAGQVGGRAWTSADTLTVDVYHTAEACLPLRIRFGVGPDEQDVVMTANYGVLPGVRTRLNFPLTALNAETVFLPRTPGRLKATLQGRPSRPEDISWFSVGTGNLGLPATVEVSQITLTPNPDVLVPQGPALVDEFGQWLGRDWVGKITDEDMLIDRLQAVASAPLAPLPANRSRFGGATEIAFEATGWFRTHHDGHRWWFVDPDGAAFWSVGADCVGPGGTCPIFGNEALCDSLPPRDEEFASAWQDGEFSWQIANLLRAFGPDWKQGWLNLTMRSFARFGFNTVGNWSEIPFALSAKIPYVLPLADFPTTEGRVFRDFPDVFSPEYAANAAEFAAQLTQYRDDPYLIGYFLRNEPLWAFGAFRLAEELLAHDPERAPHCRQALVEHLQAIYAQYPEILASDWQGLIARPEDMQELVLTDTAALTLDARDVLAAFSRKMIDAYIRIPSEVCRAVDPNHLNLGMRWAWIASDDLLAGSDACDVFSLNCYDFRVSPETVQKAAQASGRPVLIGEFHFGAIDRGLLCGGLRSVPTQHDRGLAYRYYVEQAAALPDVIGTHYFQWNDQPFLGRFDGENWQIGLVDGCHTPYPELLAAARQTHHEIYDVASGTRAPYDAPPSPGPNLGI